MGKMLYDNPCSPQTGCAGAPSLGQGRTSRGDSGALYLQPATAGMNPGPRDGAVPSAPGKQR